MKKFIKYILGLNYYSDVSLPFPLRLMSMAVVLFLLLEMNSLLSWFSISNYITVALGLYIVVASAYLKIKRLISFNKDNYKFAIATFITLSVINIRFDLNFIQLLYHVSSVIAFTLITLWDKSILINIYKYLIRFFIVIAILSTIITLMSVFGVLKALPYYVMPPAEALHIANDFDYHVYGVIVTVNNPLEDLVVKRACGILCEPGHFSILLSIFYVIERMQRHKINLPIMICGFLTLSPIFYSIFLLIEVWILVEDKKMGVGITRLIVALTAVVLVFNFLPTKTQDTIYYYVMDRNVVKLWNAYNEGNSINESLNERVNMTGLRYYNEFIKKGDIVFGEPIENIKITMSDYRTLLMQIGIVGTLLLIIECFMSVSHLPWRKKLPLLIILAIVVVHRAWMLMLFYQIFIIFLGKVVILNDDKAIIMKERKLTMAERIRRSSK